MKFVFEAKASDYDLAAEQEILLRHVSNRKAKWIAAAALCAATDGLSPFDRKFSSPTRAQTAALLQKSAE